MSSISNPIEDAKEFLRAMLVTEQKQTDDLEGLKLVNHVVKNAIIQNNISRIQNYKKILSLLELVKK